MLMNLKAVCFLLLFILCADPALAWRLETPLGETKGDDPDETIRDAERKIREGTRAPGKLPEIILERVTNPLREAFAQTGYSGLQEWIARSRDDALRAGVYPIPPHIYQKLRVYYPDHLLSIARYRVGASGDLTLQEGACNLGGQSAITLDYVIVFFDAQQAQSDYKLWAHEMTHIAQYQRWGMRDFAIHYLRDFGGVENEAKRHADAYEQVARQQMAPITTEPVVLQPIRPPSVFRNPAMVPVRFCRTNWVTCSIPPENVPMGTPCFCRDGYGNEATGQAF